MNPHAREGPRTGRRCIFLHKIGGSKTRQESRAFKQFLVKDTERRFPRPEEETVVKYIEQFEKCWWSPSVKTDLIRFLQERPIWERYPPNTCKSQTDRVREWEARITSTVRHVYVLNIHPAITAMATVYQYWYHYPTNELYRYFIDYIRALRILGYKLHRDKSRPERLLDRSGSSVTDDTDTNNASTEDEERPESERDEQPPHREEPKPDDDQRSRSSSDSGSEEDGEEDAHEGDEYYEKREPRRVNRRLRTSTKYKQRAHKSTYYDDTSDTADCEAETEDSEQELAARMAMADPIGLSTVAPENDWRDPQWTQQIMVGEVLPGGPDDYTEMYEDGHDYYDDENSDPGYGLDDNSPILNNNNNQQNQNGQQQHRNSDIRPSPHPQRHATIQTPYHTPQHDLNNHQQRRRAFARPEEVRVRPTPRSVVTVVRNGHNHRTNRTHHRHRGEVQSDPPSGSETEGSGDENDRHRRRRNQSPYASRLQEETLGGILNRIAGTGSGVSKSSAATYAARQAILESFNPRDVRKVRRAAMVLSKEAKLAYSEDYEGAFSDWVSYFASSCARQGITNAQLLCYLIPDYLPEDLRMCYEAAPPDITNKFEELIAYFESFTNKDQTEIQKSLLLTEYKYDEKESIEKNIVRLRKAGRFVSKNMTVEEKDNLLASYLLAALPWQYKATILHSGTKIDLQSMRAKLANIHMAEEVVREHTPIAGPMTVWDSKTGVTTTHQLPVRSAESTNNNSRDSAQLNIWNQSTDQRYRQRLTQILAFKDPQRPDSLPRVCFNCFGMGHTVQDQCTEKKINTTSDPKDIMKQVHTQMRRERGIPPKRSNNQRTGQRAGDRGGGGYSASQQSQPIAAIAPPPPPQQPQPQPPQPQQQQQQQEQPAQPKKKTDWSKVTCFICGEKGHTKVRCPKAQQGMQPAKMCRVAQPNQQNHPETAFEYIPEMDEGARPIMTLTHGGGSEFRTYADIVTDRGGTMMTKKSTRNGSDRPVCVLAKPQSRQPYTFTDCDRELLAMAGITGASDASDDDLRRQVEQRRQHEN
jgi:hypothetical protein